jgi:TolB-like protein
MTELSKAVFLSYASQDAEAAKLICNALRAAGIEVWFDQSELRGGDAWDQMIRRQIRDCTLFVPVISANTQSRLEGYFRREWRLAVDRSHDMAEGKPFLVPVVIDDTKDQDAEVPDSFRAVQWTRISGGETPPGFVQRILQLLAPGAHVARTSPGAAAPARTLRRSSLALLLIGAAVILGGVFAVEMFVKERAAQATGPSASSALPAAVSEKSIAVLPFVDMSEKHDQEYFSDGLSEELIDHLAHSADLMVIARTSSFQFKGKSEDVRSIAGQLGVANILEGSVRTAGPTMRITVQLIRAYDGVHLWSQAYDRQLADIFKVQDDIAEKVVEALHAALSTGASTAAPGPEGTEAYNHLLKGKFFLYRSNDGDNPRSIDEFKRAVAADPNYALAWAFLGSGYVIAGEEGDVERSEAEANGREALNHALLLDPKSARAHRFLARIYSSYHWDWASARAEYERATALDPSGLDGADARIALLILKAFTTGETEETEKAQREWQIRDPLDVRNLELLADTQIIGGKLNDAAATLQRVLELNPARRHIHGRIAEVWLLSANPPNALAEAERETDDRFKPWVLANCYWAAGRSADADRMVSSFESQFADSTPYMIAELHAFRGEQDLAFSWLERAYRQRDQDLEDLNTDPYLSHLHGDPRFKVLLRKMNLPG